MANTSLQRPSIRILAVSVAASAFLSGCFLWTTRGEGDEFAEKHEDHERRLGNIEGGIRQEREELEEQVTRARGQVDELEEVLQQATQVVTRNSADLGLEVQELREQIGRLEGQMDELRQSMRDSQAQVTAQRQEIDRQLLALAQKAGLDMPIDASEIPAEKAAHYQAAYRAYQTSDYSRSRALFRAFMTRYASDDQADNAQYWIGKSYLQQERPATALGELRKVITDHPRGDAVDDALLDMAEAFWQLRQCTDARNTLQALIAGHRRSPLLARARAKLRQVQRPRRGYCTS